MRVFLGLNEVANIMTIYARAFRALGHETLTAVVRKNPFYPDSQYDFVLKPRARDLTYYARWAHLFQQATITCDVFIFMYASLLPHFVDIPLLKRLGKKIVFMFWGSEIRDIDLFEAQMKRMNVLDEYEPFIKGMRARDVEPLRVKAERVRVAERYGDLILSQPGFGQLQSRPYMRATIPMDLRRYPFNIPARTEPLIVHAPSSPLTKGSDYIQEIVKSLKDEGLRFEFRLVENLPNTELLKTLSSADIVVDELYGDTIGMFSSEGMATGNLVMTHYPAEFARVPADCPVVNITRAVLKDRLRRAVLDLDWRCELARRGREFVERHHDHIHLAQELLSWLEPGSIQQYDFYPEEIRTAGNPTIVADTVVKKA